MPVQGRAYLITTEVGSVTSFMGVRAAISDNSCQKVRLIRRIFKPAPLETTRLDPTYHVRHNVCLAPIGP